VIILWERLLRAGRQARHRSSERTGGSGGLARAERTVIGVIGTGIRRVPRDFRGHAGCGVGARRISKHYKLASRDSSLPIPYRR